MYLEDPKIQDKKINEISVHEYKDALSTGISAASIESFSFRTKSATQQMHMIQINDDQSHKLSNLILIEKFMFQERLFYGF